MGAVPGCRLLTLPGPRGDSGIPDSPLFDVEPFRSLSVRHAEVRDVASPTLVLGSTQSADAVSSGALARGQVTLARRRSGGGAVYLAPGRQLWVDVWIPRADELWADDVVVAAAWVGAWWAAALTRVGVRDLEVHDGPARPGHLGSRVCFAGRGPGEVLHDGRKVVGLSQWRSRQGALFSTCAYVRWEPERLAQLLESGDARQRLTAELGPVAIGLGELDPSGGDLTAVRTLLLDSLSGFSPS